VTRPHATEDDSTRTGADSGETWDLRLYVTGRSPKCLRAIENLRRACEDHVPGRYLIEVVDRLLVGLQLRPLRRTAT
jgi:circadian clock protein KaiB